MNLASGQGSVVRLYALWASDASILDPVSAAYKVEHYLENADGTYSLKDVDFPLYGEVGTEVTAEARNYEHYALNPAHEDYQASGVVTLPRMEAGALEPTVLTLKLYYKLDRYTVTYTDGVDGEELFQDQVYESLLFGTSTPAFTGTLLRDGYVFKGWEPAVSPTVTGNAVYKAVWEKNENGSGNNGGGSGSGSGSGSSSGSSSGTSASSSNIVASPKTGDTSPILLLTLTGLVSLAGIGAIAFDRRKKGYHGRDGH